MDEETFSDLVLVSLVTDVGKKLKNIKAKGKEPVIARPKDVTTEDATAKISSTDVEGRRKNFASTHVHKNLFD